MEGLSSIFLSPRFRTLGALFLLIGLTGIAYYPAIDNGVIIDDQKYYLSDPLITSSEGLQQIWLNPLNNNQVWPYIPITRSSFWIERQFSGGSLPVAHTINILLHGLSAILLWFILKRFQFRGAWLTGMLFAIHPIHVQSVAWLTERKNVVSIIFYLLALWGYLDFEEKKRWRSYLVALLFFLAALLSKTSTVMLPLIFILCRFRTHSSWKINDLLYLIPFFLMALLQGIFRIWFELNLFGADTLERGFGEQFLTAGHIPFFYLTKLMIPYPLSFVYPKWMIDPAQISMYLPLLSLCLITGILLLKFRQWHRGFILGFGIFIGSLFPVLGFFKNAWTQFSFVSDHWVHIPSLPIFVLSVQGGLWTLDKITEKISVFSGLIKVFFWGSLFLTLSVLTWKQASIYQDEIALWQATLETNPHAWLPHYNLGTFYLDQKQYRLAIRHLNEALKNKPDHVKAYNNRGKAYAELKLSTPAFENYNEALKIYPHYAATYNNRGLLYSRLGKYSEALKDFSQAIQLDPKYSEAYNNRGIIHFQLEKYDQAIEDYNQALHYNPRHLKAYNNRGNAYFKLKQYDRAKHDYTRVLQFDPTYQKAYTNRALVSLQLKQFQQALQDLDKALKLAPSSVESYKYRGWLHWQVFQNREQACSDWKQACQLNDCGNYNSAKQEKICH